MPRTFDYDNEDKEAKRNAYTRGSPFAEFPIIRQGNGEITTTDLWGPRGILFMDGEHHQFNRKTGVSNFYANATVEPAFAWLENNARGRWNWMERATNHGHSVTTDVWIENEADIDGFKTAFPDLFEFRESRQRDNLQYRQAVKEAGNKGMIPGLHRGNLSHLLGAPDQDNLDFLADIQTRTGGEELITEAVVFSVGSIRNLASKKDIVPDFDPKRAINDLLVFLNGLASEGVREKVQTALSIRSDTLSATLLNAVRERTAEIVP